MRFLDLAVDIAAVFSASRSVATKHVALRTRQLGSGFPAAAEEAAKEAANPPLETSSPTKSEGAAVAAESSDAPVSATELSSPPEPTASSSDPIQPAESSHEVPEGARAAQEKPQQDVQGPEEPVLPTFIHRARLRTPRPPNVLQEKQRKAAADAAQSGDRPRPHPLDPRFKGLPRTTTANASQPGAPSIADIVDISIFSSPQKPKTADETLAELQQPVQDPTQDAAPQVSASSKDTSGGVSQQTPLAASPEPALTEAPTIATLDEITKSTTVSETVADSETVPLPTPEPAIPVLETPRKRAFELKESKVPATRLSRMWNYGGLAAGMLGGALTESISRGFGGGSPGGGSVMLSAGNLERLVSRLSRMRGAALKLGQMMSFQDAKMLPAPLQEVLQRVQDGADYMPAWQRDRVLASNLGADWRDLFIEFEEKPLAAASIGQVHRATLRSNGKPVAVKIQFPGVASSINSDLDNLSILLTATQMLPRGLYLDKTIANARTELAWECDYIREAECAQRFHKLLVEANETGHQGAAYVVPEIFPEASGKQVLTMAFMDGVGVTKVAPDLTQEQRDWIGSQILRLCLLEITQFHFMQTDPNWTNFLYNASTSKLELLDFGASREYPTEFIDLYVRLLRAAAESDLEGVKTLSHELGYLTGHESRAMIEAHTQSVLTLAEPFRNDSPEVYDFQDQTITDRVKSFIPVMVRERLTPPPEETYSLHRKLSGAFLLCARLGSRVRCREMFADNINKMNLS